MTEAISGIPLKREGVAITPRRGHKRVESALLPSPLTGLSIWQLHPVTKRQLLNKTSALTSGKLQL